MLAQALRPRLDALVRNFGRDPARSKRLIRQSVEEDKAAFLAEAIPILSGDAASQGAHYLVAVLAGAGLLLALLSSPVFSREKAFALARAAAAADPTIDVALARTLAENASALDGGALFEQYARLMEILAEISDGARIFPSLVRLLRHPNPHIRSKAVLMIGRGNRSPKWLRQRLFDTDPRIRANAAEALWGVDTGEARELLQSLVRDFNNRVAGNAILGLYRLGDCSVIPDILAMARHESPVFRATAAWVMGQTGDPRFTETVAGLLRETNPVIRKRAFSALGSLRAAVAQAVNGPRWRLSARLLDSDPARRRILLGVAPAGGGLAPALLPTHILVSEDNQPVVRYRVVERPVSETVSAVFVVPRYAGNVAAACLNWKRPSDLWATLYYVRTISSPAGAEVGLRFQSIPEERVPPASECFDVWRALAVAVNPELGGMAGKRNVILFSNAEDRPSPGEQLRAAVIAGKVFLQVISTAPDPEVEEFCRAVGGVFRLQSDDALVDAYLALFGRYEIAYQPPNPEARAARIRVQGPGMSAETTLPLTSSPSPAES